MAWWLEEHSKNTIQVYKCDGATKYKKKDKYECWWLKIQLEADLEGYYL